MRLSNDGQRVTSAPAANEFRGGFYTAVVHNDYFKACPIRLLRQGLQTLIKGCPVVVDRYDNAELWDCNRHLKPIYTRYRLLVSWSSITRSMAELAGR